MSIPKRMSFVLCAWMALGVAAGSACAETVNFLAMQAEVPDSWQAEQPASNMRLLQFAVPDSDGGEGAQFIVYYFGVGQGGGLMDNVERWRSQFSNPDGSPVKPLITELQDARMPAVLVELRGSYARGVGMGPVGEPLANRMLLAGLVETPRGSLYPQLHGPAAFVQAQREDFIAFMKSIGPDPGKAVFLPAWGLPGALAWVSSETAGVDPHVGKDTGGVTQSNDWCPLQVPEKGVLTAGLPHQGYAGGGPDGK